MVIVAIIKVVRTLVVEVVILVTEEVVESTSCNCYGSNRSNNIVVVSVFVCDPES